MVTVSDENTDDESTNASTQTISCIDIQRYRSLEKAIRVTAYVLRFIQNLRNSRDKRTIGFISVEERCKALEVLIVAAQQQTFKDEIESLNSSSQKKVQLVRQLKLYTDKSGLLRYDHSDTEKLTPDISSPIQSEPDSEISETPKPSTGKKSTPVSVSSQKGLIQLYFF
ncbi:unnamed protein product [Mytilus edulis]|uniref:Uncharacterized protein n=1 Tax=Mytilus edulis TaxID=6550 RepID=A0A8S3QXK7_MYTED|nr:unnamed protein product [Mytilus edulis]